MANPRKRKAAIKIALESLSKAKNDEQKQAVSHIAEEVAKASEQQVDSADWLLKKAEELAAAIDTAPSPPPSTAKPVTKSPKKKATKKRTKRGTRKSKN